MHTIEAANVSAEDMIGVDQALKQIPQESALAEQLASLLDTIRRGRDVVFGGVDTEVSPAEAAHILHMSRPHLYKLLDDGALPFKRVGTHRRLALGDVLEFQVQQSAGRRELAETFAHAEADRDALAAQLAGIPESRRSSLLR